jgi:ribosomal protein S18 acetylase RimI-like enzyme
MPVDPVRIVPYRDEYAADFDRLNREWLEGYGLLEPLDETYLRAPRQLIVEPGGQIFFAVTDIEVLGTCAALWHEPGVLELAKLAVAPAARGRGLGRILAQTVIDFAREAGARRVILVSSTKLVQALRLYESLGFQHRPLPPNPDYVTADVYMELELPSV